MSRFASLLLICAVGCGPGTPVQEYGGDAGLRGEANEYTNLEMVYRVVDRKPPAPRSEAVPPQPSARHVWIPGWWGWSGEAFAWRPGHWAMPPSSRSPTRWIAPRWRSVSGGWQLRPGYWKVSPP